jgi:hypothetical protein
MQHPGDARIPGCLCRGALSASEAGSAFCLSNNIIPQLCPICGVYYVNLFLVCSPLHPPLCQFLTVLSNRPFNLEQHVLPSGGHLRLGLAVPQRSMPYIWTAGELIWL